MHNVLASIIMLPPTPIFLFQVNPFYNAFPNIANHKHIIGKVNFHYNIHVITLLDHCQEKG